MLLDKELPIPLTDRHGILWVDNADGTVTNTQDENDGRPDQGWDGVDVRSAGQLHGYVCRDVHAEHFCPGGAECADDERHLMLVPRGPVEQ